MYLIYYYESYYGAWAPVGKKSDKEIIWNMIVYVEKMNDPLLGNIYYCSSVIFQFVAFN